MYTTIKIKCFEEEKCCDLCHGEWWSGLDECKILLKFITLYLPSTDWWLKHAVQCACL